MNFSTKQKQTHRVVAKRDQGWGRVDWEFGVSRCKQTVIYRMDIQQGPTV